MTYPLKPRSFIQTTCLALLLLSIAVANGSKIYRKYHVNVVNSFDENKYQHCGHIRAAGYSENGLYRLHADESPFLIHCTFENGQAVGKILQRLNGLLNFQDKTYKNYQQGFEDTRSAERDFWLGLDKIHSMTKDGNTGLKVSFRDWRREYRQVSYDVFQIASQTDQYRMTIGGFQGGPAKVGDMMSSLNGSVFYAVDNPDSWNCARDTKSGWWFSDVLCSGTLPTGHYYEGGKYTPSGDRYDGMYWQGFHGMDYSLFAFWMEVVHRT